MADAADSVPNKATTIGGTIGVALLDWSCSCAVAASITVRGRSAGSGAGPS
eukprot:CAMPEP_0204333034 /NCGR_PEP_ID=MMETSP0469-20131031/16908_1 /ASSEMBLY_ACC=CAM_ASM_000384 /TAXON_ID=2969 /ORGANISM="Oxyrrhis marina" /LENGTH=50 /DNA_ID=CAMNT_0051316293 /DNA_START=550 /DNA_END=698 /DNA_ORIENTATION=+